MTYRNALFALALAGISNPSMLSAATFSFTQGGFSEGAAVQGFFTGEDKNNDGWIFSGNNTIPDEIDDFSINFTGNSLVPAFTIDASSETGFFILYTLGSGGLSNSFIPGTDDFDGLLITEFRSDGFEEIEIPAGSRDCIATGTYCGRVIYFNVNPDPSGPDQIDESFETAVVTEMFDPVDPEDPVSPPDPVDPPTPVPVPASVLLMASGLLLLSLVRQIFGGGPGVLSRRVRARSAEC